MRYLLIIFFTLTSLFNLILDTFLILYLIDNFFDLLLLIIIDEIGGLYKVIRYLAVVAVVVRFK